MKNIKRLVIVVALGLAVCGLALAAQVHRMGGFSHDAAQFHGDPASIAEHLSEVFPQVAEFDANKDGQLDDAERKVLARALADRQFQLPAHTPPHGTKPTPEMMVNHIAEMYTYVTTYDANHDGQIDAKEQAAIQSAIEKGEFAPHGLHQEHGPGAHH